MKFTPRDYQTLITNHILETDRCAVWAGMGLGKTTGTLNAIDALQMVESDPVLVVAPLRVARSTWPDEARKWDHLKGLNVMPVVGSEPERRMALRHDAQVYTTNYEQLPWLVDYWGERWPYRTVVLDESTKVKGFRLRQGAQRAKALGRVAHSKVKRIVELTGTPQPQRAAGLVGPGVVH